MRLLLDVHSSRLVDAGILEALGASSRWPAGLVLGLALDNDEVWKGRKELRAQVLRRLSWLRPLLPRWHGRKEKWSRYFHGVLLPARSFGRMVEPPPARPAVRTSTVPRKYLDLAKQSRIRSQGDAPTCLCFAVCSCVEAADMQSGHPGDWRSPGFLAYAAGTTSGGTTIGAVHEGLAKRGLPMERSFPYDPAGPLPGPRPPESVIREALRLRPPEICPVAIRNLEETRQILASGQSIVCGVPVYNSWLNRYTTATGIVPDPLPGDTLRGYHALLMVGYDEHGVYFKNSWSWFDALGRPRGWATDSPSVAPGFGKLSNRYVQEHALPSALRIPRGRLGAVPISRRPRARAAAAAAMLLVGAFAPNVLAIQPGPAEERAVATWRVRIVEEAQQRGLDVSPLRPERCEE